MFEVESIYRILQVIGLSLPAIALDMTVLVEIHMITGINIAPIAPYSDMNEGESSNDREIKGEHYTYRLTDAASQTDFALSLFSFTVLLFSSIILIISLFIHVMYILGVIFTIIGFASLILSIGITLKNNIKNILKNDRNK